MRNEAAALRECSHVNGFDIRQRGVVVVRDLQIARRRRWRAGALRADACAAGCQQRDWQEKPHVDPAKQPRSAPHGQLRDATMKLVPSERMTKRTETELTNLKQIGLHPQAQRSAHKSHDTSSLLEAALARQKNLPTHDRF